MDENGYAFTPVALLLIIPVIILAISYNSIVDELNTLSVILIGGDVTGTVGDNLVNAIQEDVSDAGRNAAYNATRKVVDDYNLNHTNSFFGLGGSKSYIINNTVSSLNSNLVSTCKKLEMETGREITINNKNIDVNDNSSLSIIQPNQVQITQSDPFGFYIIIPSMPVTVVQNSSQNYQNMTLTIPQQIVYVSIKGLEDPSIWVNTKARTSSLIYEYPYYDASNTNDRYEFDVHVSSGKLDNLWACMEGANSSALGYRPYYFPDPSSTNHTGGLSFFDRLDGVRNTSESPNSQMSTFILNDPLQGEHSNVPTSSIDWEYFSSVPGVSITTTDTATGEVNQVLDPTLKPFYLSTNYMSFFNLSSNYDYTG